MIKKEQTILELIQQHPEVIEYLMQKGFHCIGCGAAAFETIEQGAIVHGMNPDQLIKELNEFVKKNKQTAQMPEEKDYRIEHDEKGCIGCAACSSIYPEQWEMVKKDGEIKAKAKQKTFSKEEFEKNKEAAEICPVNVIHIHNKKTNEKLI